MFVKKILANLFLDCLVSQKTELDEQMYSALVMEARICFEFWFWLSFGFFAINKSLPGVVAISSLQSHVEDGQGAK